MKSLLYLVLLVNLSCSLKAQVLSLYNNPNYGNVVNAYYKDIDNFQNQFEGTWIYVNELTRLEIKFRKKEMMLQNPGQYQFYEDVLVGEYKYIDEKGFEKVNSLSNFTLEHAKDSDYNLYSGPKIKNFSFPVCNECPISTERLLMFFDEPANDDFGLAASFVMWHIEENGIEKIKAKFVHVSSAINNNKENIDLPSIFREFSLPYGEYILIKQ